MRLSEYLERNKTHKREFAALIGVTSMAVHQWMNGVRTPRIEFLQKIAKATKGRVQPSDFFPPEAAE